MLCVDIDGTLLNSQHEVTEITRKAINSIADEVYVILVSARMPSGILYLLSELQLSMPIISYSGGLVLDENSDILLDKIMSLNILQEIYENFHREIHFSLYQKDIWYVENEDRWARQEADITATIPEIIDFQDLFSKMKEEKTGVNKVLCMGQPPKIEKLEANLKINYKNRLSIYRSKPTYLEIMDKSVSKTAAIKYLQQLFNVNREEVTAIGDNFNDVDMIEYAGLGVVMGNAPVEVKKIADRITLSNDDNGVAAVINNYF